MLVWAGNDDNTKLSSSESKKTKKIFSKTITSLENTNSWYEIPNSITAAIIDPISGDLSINGKGFVCYYEKGTEPNYKYYFQD